jgi:hypothetical protein
MSLLGSYIVSCFMPVASNAPNKQSSYDLNKYSPKNRPKIDYMSFKKRLHEQKTQIKHLRTHS